MKLRSRCSRLKSNSDRPELAVATTPPTFTIHETHDFVRWVRRNRLTTAVNKLKADLHGDPETGAVIPGGGGLRKVRMGGRGRGKRGGFRVIYVLFLEQTASLLLTGYSKSEKEDLPPTS